MFRYKTVKILLLSSLIFTSTTNAFFENTFFSYFKAKATSCLALVGFGFLFYNQKTSNLNTEKKNSSIEFQSSKEEVENQFKIVTANINLMPQGLNIATTGKADERATQIADSLLNQHPGAEVYVLQEMYDDEPSNVLIEKLKVKGFDYYPGPTKEQLKKYWHSKYGSVSVSSAKNSGEGIFIRKNSGLNVESYDVLPFFECGIEGIGILESSVPKGVIHIKLSRNQEGGQTVSLFGHHLQAEIGLFGLANFVQGQWSQIPKTIASDFIHFQPFQKLREKYPNYLASIRTKQINATMNWMRKLTKNDKVAKQIIHLGDFNLVAGCQEYKRLLSTLEVVPATDQTDLVTIGNQENTTWSTWTRPFYRMACKYVNNYGWMDLVLLDPNLKNKVDAVNVVDLKNRLGQSVTDHESVSMTLNNVFKK